MHGRKVGHPFLQVFFPLQQLSVASIIEILPRPCCSLPHSLSSGSYWDSPKPMPTSSVMAKGTRDNIQSKAKPTIHHLPCSAGIEYSLVWFMRKSMVSWKPLLESMIWDAATSSEATRKLWRLWIWSLHWSATDVPFTVSTIPTVPTVCRAFS